MFHYLFTNDLRISNLDNVLQEAGRCFKDDCVPSASEDKNANNNMNTLGFYFNFTRDSNCSIEAAKGNVRTVVLNFIKKFQFPNPRTDASLNDAVNDNISLAPMRTIVSILYTMQTVCPDDAYLTNREIADYVFFYDAVAKTEKPDILAAIKEIVDNRKTPGSSDIPDDAILEQQGIYWKQCKRQIREMVKVLTWTGCVITDDKGAIRIHHDNLTRDNKADLFEILTYKDFWKHDPSKSFKENKADYQKYMDLERTTMAEQTKDIDYNEQKKRFKSWLLEQRKANGEPYSQGTLNNYIYCMERGYQLFDSYNGYVSPFQIQDLVSAEEYTTYLFNAEGFEEFNITNSYKSCECGWAKYKEFLMEQSDPYVEPVYKTSLDKDFPRNRIFFGAPGTGKSFTINQDKDVLLGKNNESDYERVTFHPDYSYANFVGTYKPIPKKDGSISYEYVPGPFMRVYVNAILNGRTDDVKPFLLIVEEINRANVAAVFGDVFQLLDRDKNGVSEYPIQVSEDARVYLASRLGGVPDNYSSIRIPNNMFIWATMNSADQGVYPMDTAFKRRWSFKYISIDNNEEKIAEKTVALELTGGSGEKQSFKWNDLRKAINNMLGALKINEDKMLGTFFISLKDLGEGNDINSDVFKEVFKSKVLMYLFEDAARQRRDELFEGSKTENKTIRYSDLCDDFDKHGVKIFNEKIYKALEK